MQRLNRSDSDSPLVVDDQPAHPIGCITTAPGLLVSVRNEAEVVQAAEIGVDIIDFKDPLRGALGPACPELWRDAAHRYPHLQLSAALGELDEAASLASQVSSSFRFAKAGPVGAKTVDELVAAWQMLRTELPGSVALVAVAYADHENSQTLTAEQIFAAAKQVGLGTWLLDTYAKDGQSSIAYGGQCRLKTLLQLASAANAKLALAGSISLELAQDCLQHHNVPAWFAVRGDVCHAGRTTGLSNERLQLWKQWLSSLA